MSDGVRRQRSKAFTIGSIPVAAATVFATSTGMPAQADTAMRANLDGSRPAWATPAAALGPAPAAQDVTVRVYLAGRDPSGLAAAARAVADPNSPQFHQYLTPTQIGTLFGPTADQVAKVTGWLTGSGLTVRSGSGDWIDATGPIASVQTAFGTEIKNYALPDGSVHYAPASVAQVPIGIAGSISGVSGLFDSPAKRKKADSVASPASAALAAATPTCSAYWGQKTTSAFPQGANPGPIPVDTCPLTPKQLRDAYGVTASGFTGKGTTIAIIDAYGSPTMLADADRFATNHGDKPFASGQYREIVTPSAWNSQSACGTVAGWAGEESLDVDMAHGLAPDANILYVGANSCNDPDFLTALSSVVDTHSADVVSDSWGGLMHTTQGDEDPAVMAAYDRVFQKGALEGIGFDFSTGDCGDDDPANLTGGGMNCAPSSTRKQVEWPASSQWVTAVGGTTLATDAKGQYAWELPMGDNVTSAYAGDPGWSPAAPVFALGGGGGTSEVTAQPAYQKNAVPASLSGTLMNGGQASQPMRTIPDVAMVGSLASMVLVGQTDPATSKYAESGEGGTSAAAPLFSAMLADAMQGNGGNPIGFANPAIYALAGTTAFRDVTQQAPGQPATVETVQEFVSPSTTTLGGALVRLGRDSSLTAAPGYDEATGLGSPTVDFLTKLAAAHFGPAVGRLSGSDRYQTGIAVSQKAFPAAGSAPAVVLATGENFPDALSGVPLAKKLGASLLLTPSAAPDSAVTSEVRRVLAAGGKVYVLGGAKAVSPSVVAALNLPAAQVQRIAGVDRYDTSVQIAGVMGAPTRVVLATGQNFPDALAAGPYAAAVFGNGSPAAILLTQDNVLTPDVRHYLASATAVAAVGGQAVHAAAGLPNVTAFRGADRFDTAAQVAATFTGEKTAGVATGIAFADALTGAAFLAGQNGPLVLTDHGSLPGSTAAALQKIAPGLGRNDTVYVVGGPAAVDPVVEQQIADAVGGRVV